MRIPPAVYKILSGGGIGVLPTDTMYGVVGQALSEYTVKRLYRVRKRNPKKPFIILIQSLDDLKLFDIRLTIKEKNFLGQVWPGPVSVILPCSKKGSAYLHRGMWGLAFRLPARTDLRKLIKKTGPLVAPSANLEGRNPAQTIWHARQYFGDHVDFYLDCGRIKGQPSTLVELGDGVVVLRRRGKVPLSEIQRKLQA